MGGRRSSYSTSLARARAEYRRGLGIIRTSHSLRASAYWRKFARARYETKLTDGSDPGRAVIESVADTIDEARRRAQRRGQVSELDYQVKQIDFLSVD